MKKILLLIACAYGISIHAMDEKIEVDQPKTIEQKQQREVFEICQKVIDEGRWEALVPNIKEETIVYTPPFKTTTPLSPQEKDLHKKINLLVPLQAVALRSVAEQRKEWFYLKAKKHTSVTQKPTTNPSANDQSMLSIFNPQSLKFQGTNMFENQQRSKITFDLISHLLDPIIENNRKK